MKFLVPILVIYSSADESKILPNSFIRSIFYVEKYFNLTGRKFSQTRFHTLYQQSHNSFAIVKEWDKYA